MFVVQVLVMGGAICWHHIVGAAFFGDYLNHCEYTILSILVDHTVLAHDDFDLIFIVGIERYIVHSIR